MEGGTLTVLGTATATAIETVIVIVTDALEVKAEAGSSGKTKGETATDAGTVMTGAETTDIEKTDTGTTGVETTDDDARGLQDNVRRTLAATRGLAAPKRQSQLPNLYQQQAARK